MTKIKEIKESLVTIKFSLGKIKAQIMQTDNNINYELSKTTDWNYQEIEFHDRQELKDAIELLQKLLDYEP